MVTILQSPVFYTYATTLHCSSRNQKTRKRKHLHHKQFQENKNTTLSFRKSSPTPLLINHKPIPQTKLQALDAVIKDLESSIENGIPIDVQIYASLLETCYRLKAIDYGIRIHQIIPKHLLYRNLGISSKLLRLYASFGYIDNAHDLFDQMSKRNSCAFVWNSLISGYAKLGQYEDAIALYFQMEEEEVEPDRFTFPRVLKACGGIGSIRIGEIVHRDSVRAGFGNDVFVLNALVDMYSKCGDIVKARKVFDMISCKDSISWNSMLTGYTRHGLVIQAVEIFRGMVQNGIEPDSVSISAILTCASSMEVAAQIHGWVVRQGMEWDLSVANSLMIVYSNKGRLNQTRWLFDQMPEKDIVSWNTIISAHSRIITKALTYFDKMEMEGVLPDNVTFVSILSSCAHLGLVKDGERLYSLMQKKYGIRPIMEHYACMVNLYGRAGLIDEAYSVIVDEMELEAGATVWGALLYACCLHGNVGIGEIAAENVFELEPDNEHNFELLMKIYGDAKRFEDVERVRKMMVERGLDVYSSISIHI